MHLQKYDFQREGFVFRFLYSYLDSGVVAQHWLGGTTSFGAPYKTVTVVCCTMCHGYSKVVNSRLYFEIE